MNTAVGTSRSLGASLDNPDRHLLEFGRLSSHQKSDNQTEQAKDRAEDLDNQNPDESIVPLSARSLEKGIVWETYRLGSAASANAAPLPLMPTEIPQIKLQNPTVTPPQKRA